MLRVSGGISDEGFSGSRVRDTDNKNRFTREGADFLVDTIKKATKPIENISQGNKAVISQVAGKIFDNLAKNTEQVQAIVESQGDETINEFNTLVKMMADAQTKTGEASVTAIKEVIKQIENIKIAAGDRSEELSASLGGFDEVQKTLSDQVTVRRETIGDAIFKKLTGVDKRSESPLRAFSMEKMFGLKPGTGNILEQAKQEAKLKADSAPVANSQVALVKKLFGETKKDNKSSVVKDTNAEGGIITAGIDRESLQNKQVKLLEQILEQLKKVELGENTNNKSLMDSLKDMLKGAAATASVLTKFAGVGGSLLLPLKDLYDIISGKNGGANNENAGGVTGAIIGGAIGSIFGPLGTAAGITIGNLAGEKIGEFIDKSDAIAREKFDADPANANKTEQELNEDFAISRGKPGSFEAAYARRQATQLSNLRAARESGLYEKRGLFKDSYVSLYALNNATDPNQLQAILNDDDISDGIRAKIEQKLSELQSVTPYMAPAGSGVLNLEEQTSRGMSPNVTRTAEAVGNMSDLYSDVMGSVMNNVNNIVNNNYQGGGSNNSSPILVNADGSRNTNSSYIIFQNKQYTR